MLRPTTNHLSCFGMMAKSKKSMWDKVRCFERQEQGLEGKTSDVKSLDTFLHERHIERSLTRRQTRDSTCSQLVDSIQVEIDDLNPIEWQLNLEIVDRSILRLVHWCRGQSERNKSQSRRVNNVIASCLSCFNWYEKQLSRTLVNH